jgi:hypothetical protein
MTHTFLTDSDAIYSWLGEMSIKVSVFRPLLLGNLATHLQYAMGGAVHPEPMLESPVSTGQSAR